MKTYDVVSSTAKRTVLVGILSLFTVISSSASAAYQPLASAGTGAATQHNRLMNLMATVLDGGPNADAAVQELCNVRRAMTNIVDGIERTINSRTHSLSVCRPNMEILGKRSVKWWAAPSPTIVDY